MDGSRSSAGLSLPRAGPDGYIDAVVQDAVAAEYELRELGQTARIPPTAALSAGGQVEHTGRTRKLNSQVARIAAISSPSSDAASSAAIARAARVQQLSMASSSQPNTLLGGTVGIVGLGNIGLCVCKRLICAGFRVKTCEIKEETRAMLVKMGAEVVSNPAAAASDVALLIVSVFTNAQVEDVLFGNADSGEAGAITELPAGATVCLHTTVSPDQASAFAARLEKTDHHFLDAPIIGGKVGADTGTLTIVASGDDVAIEASTNPLRQVGERFFRCGTAAGAASAVKMIDSMLVGIHTVAAAEAITFAAKCGASPTQVHKALQHGMGNSRVFEKWVPAMMNTDFESMGKTGMAAMKKDLSIVLESAKEFSYPMPMTALALQQFCGSTALSNTRQDAPSVVQLYEKLGAVNLSAAAKGRGRTKMYRVVQTARLRNGFELDSELIGSLEPGDVLRVLEERQNENGVVRVRCSRGWTSVDGRDGAPLLEPVAAEPRGPGMSNSTTSLTSAATSGSGSPALQRAGSSHSANSFSRRPSRELFRTED